MKQVVKVILQQATSPPHMDGSMVFARWQQCAPRLMLPWLTLVHIQNDVLIGSAIFAQLTAESRYALQRAAPFPLKIAHSHGDLDPIYYMIPWANPSPQPKQHIDWFGHFCTAHRRMSLNFNGPVD